MATTEPPPLVTECPNCHTRFRVGESQLQIAHGRVRCGACLAVFAGVDHLLLDDAVAAPELTSERNMLESVLAELAEEADVVEPEEMPPGATSRGASAARTYELEALAARRREPEELELSDGFIAAEEADKISVERGLAEDADWTSVAVDTQELGSSAEHEPREPRATINDALQDEEALRWWLEDELPGVAAHTDDDMVVQLSELDAVQDDDLDLQELVGQPENGSKRQLEALFQELREDEEREKTAGEDAATTPADRTSAVEPEFEPRNDEALPSDEVAGASERSAEELHKAIDQAEPLVTRAMTSKTLAASANKVAAAERAAAAQEAAAAARDLGATSSSADAPVVAGKPTVPSGRPIQLVEPPSARRAAQAQAAQAGRQAPAAVESAAVESAAVESAAVESAAVESAAAKSAAAKSAAVKRAAAKSAVVNKPAAEKRAAARQNDAAPPTTARANPRREQPAPKRATAPATSSIADTAAAFWTQATGSVEQFLGNPFALRIGTVLASVVLVGQIMYSQFDDWAKSPTLRPLYGQICAVTGCQLPVRRSVQDMLSRKLAVRSHPDKSDMLLVDALIINEAEFAQPFPLLELQFMDLNQQVVQSYQLEPSSYLDGELAGSKALMAVRTPIHIDIEVADPGPNAVNYQLQFR